MVVTNGVNMKAAIIASVLEEQLPRIQRAFEERGFAEAGELADRHGALQLTFTKENNGLAQFVLLSEAVGTGENDYRGSVDVVLQAADRFVRRRVVASHSRDAFEREVTGAAVETAVALADSLNEEDLVESFALRRPDSDQPMTDQIAKVTMDLITEVENQSEMPSSNLKAS